MFLETRPDERIGWVGRRIDGRMTGEKGFAQGAYFVCVCVCVCVCECVEGEGWTGVEKC